VLAELERAPKRKAGLRELMTLKRRSSGQQGGIDIAQALAIR
jgi:hypothetical protein